MVDSLDDGRDFNKARGFLLTYSALVLALWYFGADLTQFKLMGNEVQLHQRTNSVWLVLAALNAYFWFRCYQRLPAGGLYFDNAMDQLYVKSLEGVTLFMGRRKLNRKILSDLASRDRAEAPFTIGSYYTQISQRPLRKDKTLTAKKETLKSRLLLEKYRVKMFMQVKYRFKSDNGWTDSESSDYFDLHAVLTWPVKMFVILKGALITPWFTDHIAPLLFGGMSTAFALWKWYSINFLASSLQHHTLMCAGVSTATHGQLSFLL